MDALVYSASKSVTLFHVVTDDCSVDAYSVPDIVFDAALVLEVLRSIVAVYIPFARTGSMSIGSSI